MLVSRGYCGDHAQGGITTFKNNLGIGTKIEILARLRTSLDHHLCTQWSMRPIIDASDHGHGPRRQSLSWHQAATRSGVSLIAVMQVAVDETKPLNLLQKPLQV
jgi:hypothetical protein